MSFRIIKNKQLKCKSIKTLFQSLNRNQKGKKEKTVFVSFKNI